MSFLRQIRSKADEVALEADKALRIQRKQGEIGQLQKQVQQKFNDLGSAAYGLHQDRQALPPTLLPMCQAIDDLFANIRERQDEIEAIRQEALPGVPAASGLRCSQCGQPLPAGAVFCHHCGARVPPPKPMMSCPHCGIPLPLDARFCANCGNPIVSSTTPPVPQPTPLVIAPSLQRCDKCGAELAPGALFCPTCGAPTAPRPTAPAPPLPALSPTVQPTVITTRPCPNCQQAIPIDAVFCPECGSNLSVKSDSLTPEADPEVSGAPTASNNSDLGSSFSCTVCGTELPGEAVFCAVCGTPRKQVTLD